MKSKAKEKALNKIEKEHVAFMDGYEEGTKDAKKEMLKKISDWLEGYEMPLNFWENWEELKKELEGKGND